MTKRELHLLGGTRSLSAQNFKKNILNFVRVVHNPQITFLCFENLCNTFQSIFYNLSRTAWAISYFTIFRSTRNLILGWNTRINRAARFAISADLSCTVCNIKESSAMVCKNTCKNSPPRLNRKLHLTS